MPTSGARSGTNPARPAPAGDGRTNPEGKELRCGHFTKSGPAVSGSKTLWFCPNGCGLVAAMRA